MWSDGNASVRSTSSVGTRTVIGLRMTATATPCQNFPGRRTVETRGSLPMSMRGPSSARSAGSSVIAKSTASATTMAPADAHDREIRAAEEEETREAGRDGETREHHRASRRVHRLHERVAVALAPRELLPVATHDEERVVDGHAEADEGAEVDRVLRDLDDVREREHEGDPAEHREPTDADRQRRRRGRAEDEEQHEERQRDGDELRTNEIALEYRREVDEERDLARARDREAVARQLLPELRPRREPVLDLASHRDERQRGVRVCAPEPVDHRTSAHRPES